MSCYTCRVDCNFETKPGEGCSCLPRRSGCHTCRPSCRRHQRPTGCLLQAAAATAQASTGHSVSPAQQKAVNLSMKHGKAQASWMPCRQTRTVVHVAQGLNIRYPGCSTGAEASAVVHKGACWLINWAPCHADRPLTHSPHVLSIPQGMSQECPDTQSVSSAQHSTALVDQECL